MKDDEERRRIALIEARLIYTSLPTIKQMEGSDLIVKLAKIVEEFLRGESTPNVNPELAYPTCSWCLADVENTQPGDNLQGSCPVCGSGYTGPERKKEFQLLLNAGMVKL